jgi:hypothetical protein
VWIKAHSGCHNQVKVDWVDRVKVSALLVPVDGTLPDPVQPIQRQRLPLSGLVVSGAEA